MKVIIINGPMGVGKTATGKRVADRIPGTAFIDGDWCMDIHPFVGSRETKAMAVDNILHMVRNYQRCSACGGVVLTWLMDEAWVIESLLKGLAALHAEAHCFTLICDEATLIRRWRLDRHCEWRTDPWLKASLASLERFAAMENAIDTGGLSVDQAAETVLQNLCESDRRTAFDPKRITDTEQGGL